MYQLIISEKPAAAAKIAYALGKAERKLAGKVGYFEVQHGSRKIVVAPAVGHLFTLAPKAKVSGYPVFDVEWTPTYEASKEAAFAKPYAENIRKLAKGANDFVVACDFDLEGEVIGLNCIRYLCGQKDAKRMKFSTLTAQDLQDAYEDMSLHIDWGLAEAGETRHYLDYYYGISLSRAATSALMLITNQYKTLSIGRVQGPALALLTERELEIQGFKPEPYWQIFIELQPSKLLAIHEKERFIDEKEAKNIFQKVKDKPAKVSAVEKTEQNVLPPAPFDLTTLQTEAWRCFRINPKHTLEIAQELYTQAYISYPRTSSQQIPEQINCKKILVNLTKQKIYADLANKTIQKGNFRPHQGKKTDPAHPAIHPTGEMPSALDNRQRAVYDLIVKRFLASFGEPAIRETTSIRFDVEKEIFILKGTRTKLAGWQEFYAPYVKKEETELPRFQKDEIYQEKTKMQKKMTEPPKRYTQASIIRELENRNLGTKATRAQIVDTLFQRGYLSGTAIEVTKLGQQIVDTFKRYAPDILSEELTRKFEEEMGKIQERTSKPKEFLDEAKKVLIKICRDFDAHKKEIGAGLSKAVVLLWEKESVLMACPTCKKGQIKILRSRTSGKNFAGCSNYPACHTSYPLPPGKILPSGKTCEKCGTAIYKVIRARRKVFEMCLDINCPSKAGWKNAKTG